MPFGKVLKALRRNPLRDLALRQAGTGIRPGFLEIFRNAPAARFRFYHGLCGAIRRPVAPSCQAGFDTPFLTSPAGDGNMISLESMIKPLHSNRKWKWLTHDIGRPIRASDCNLATAA